MDKFGVWTWIVISSVITYIISLGYLKLRVRQLRKLFNLTLKNLQKDSVLLPSLVEWKIDIQKYYDDAISDSLIYKKRPAKKAALEIKEARTLAREYKKEFLILRNQLYLYETLAPWLNEQVELNVNELINSLNESKDEVLNEINSSEYDPIEKYVPKIEWKKLTPTKRNQLALERYLDPKRKKDLWRIGIDYERYIGYLYENKKYKVIFHGAINEKEDLGIDLICENDKEIFTIQCKRLSVAKGIPVRENVVAQIYGASKYFKMKNKTKKTVIPVIYTTYELSAEAKDFANFLGVEFHEYTELKNYPVIKCNISGNNEKIYHLPMDQQYDKIVIGDRDGEFYAKTIIEAEKAGFRRAFKWTGAS